MIGDPWDVHRLDDSSGDEFWAIDGPGFLPVGSDDDLLALRDEIVRVCAAIEAQA